MSQVTGEIESNAVKRVLLITKNDFRAELDGGSKRTSAVMREFIEAGFEVDYVTVKPRLSNHPVTTRPNAHDLGVLVSVLWTFLLTGSLSMMRWFSLRATLLVSQLVSRGSRNYTIVVVEYTNLSPYVRAVGGIPTILDMHNIESELLENYATSATTRLRRAAARYESRRVRDVERWTCRVFSHIAVVSRHDAELLESLQEGVVRSNFVLAPNGVSDECFHYAGERGNQIVFVAHLGWRPNVDAARWLVKEVWPLVAADRGDLELHLVGRDPAPDVWALQSERVKVIPNVVSTLPYVGSAAAATAPLLAAGGTRLKILEALAVGTPVVSTPLGALGLEDIPRDVMATTADPREFAAAILSLSCAAPERDAIRSTVEEYRWGRALGALMSLALSVAVGRFEDVG